MVFDFRSGHICSTALLAILVGSATAGFADNLYRLGSPQQLNIGNATKNYSPRIVCAEDGPLLAVWANTDADSKGVVVRSYDLTGDPTSGEVQVNVSTTGVQDSPVIARDAAGNYVIAWRDFVIEGPGNDTGVRGRLFSSSGVATPEFAVNTYSPGEQSDPEVARAAAGNFVVVWDGYGPGAVYGAWMRRFDAAGTPLDIETLVAVGGQYPKIAFNPVTGGFVIAWHFHNGTDFEVRAQRYDSVGAPLGSVINVNSSTTGSQYFASLAVRANGDFVVLFEGEGQGDDEGVLGQLFTATGTPVGGEFWVNNELANRQSGSRAEFDASGGFTVLWSTVFDATHFRGFAAHFSSTAAHDGMSDLPVTATLAASHSQLVTGLCRDGSSTFRTAYSDLNAAATVSEVFSQRLTFAIFSDGFESLDTTAWLP
ncbi:MAG: hypothetical protein ABI689_13310 [Thermoanaerobaculia bacterium]